MHEPRISQNSIEWPGLLASHVCGRAQNGLDWIDATGQGRVLLRGTPTHVTLKPPTGGDRLPERFLRAARYVAPRPYVIELNDAMVWGSDGMVLTSDGCVLEDLGRLGHRSIDKHPIWTTESFSPTRISGTSAVIANPGANRNISHFLADSLARAALVTALGVTVDNWLVNSADEQWQHDAHELLISQHGGRIISLDHAPCVRADRLVVASRTGFATTTAPWARERLTWLHPKSQTTRHRRILISRKQATGRRLANEDQILEALLPLGFELVSFERRRLADQFDLFAQAEIIVGVHGAAMGHLITAPSGGSLVEIVNPAEPHPEYWALAQLSGWAYAPVVGDIATLANNAHYSDLTTPPDKISTTVREMLGNRGAAIA